MVRNNSQDRDSPGLVEVLAVLGAAYSKRDKRYHERPPCPLSNPDGSESAEEAAWTATWKAEQDANTLHPLLWLCERIVNLTGLDFDDVRKASLNYGSGWHLFKSQPTGMPDKRVPRKITRELRALDRDRLSGPKIQEMVRKFRDHPDIVQLLDEFPQLKPQARRGGSKYPRTKRQELSPAQEAVVELRDVHKQDFTAIALIRKCTPQAVQQLYERARKKPGYKQRSVNLSKVKTMHANTREKGYRSTDD